MARRTSFVRRRGASRARLMLPMAGLGLLCACVGVLVVGRSSSGETVSQVKRRIQQIALSGGEEGGEIGPWRVTAERIDPVTGTLLGFRIDSGRMIIAAEEATLVVDPDENTFSFELSGVVFTRVPGEEEPDAGVHGIETHVLGPAPWGTDIVPDAKAPPFEQAPSPFVQAE